LGIAHYNSGGILVSYTIIGGHIYSIFCAGSLDKTLKRNLQKKRPIVGRFSFFANP